MVFRNMIEYCFEGKLSNLIRLQATKRRINVSYADDMEKNVLSKKLWIDSHKKIKLTSHLKSAFEEL